MAGGCDDASLVSVLVRSRAAVFEAACTSEQHRLVGPVLAEIDRAITVLDPPSAAASVPLTTLEGTVAARGLLETVLDYSPHGILVCDVQGKLTLRNRAAERIWAGSATTEAVEGWGQYRAFHPDGRPFEPGDWAMARALKTGEIVDAEEVHFQRFDGTHGILLGSAAPVYDEDGVITGAVSTFADITRFKSLERDLRLREAWLSTTLLSIADGVIATDDRGRIEFMNAVAERVTGVPVAEAEGRRVDELLEVVDERTRAPVEGLAARVLRARASIEEGNLLLLRADSEVVIDQSGAPLRSEAGDTIGVVMVLRDVTERRQAERRRRFIGDASWLLASSALDYEGTLDRVARLGVPSVADWCVVDMAEPDGSLVRGAVAHVDPARAKVAVRLRETPQAKELVDPSAHARAVLRQLVAAASDPAYEALLAAVRGSSMISVPLRARDRTIGMMTFIRVESGRAFGPEDASLAWQLGSSAALALDNARLFREAQRVNRVKDEFLATLSHELRTPLNAILGWARLLRMGKLDERGSARALETIERNALAQAQLVEDLLDVSRIISGKFRMDVRSVDLRAVTEAAIESVRLAAESKGIELFAGLDAVPPFAGDPTRLQQVVWNLLSNAIKFTPRGGRVDVRLARVGSHVEMEVADDGPGIDPDFLPYVFDRFRQADGTTTRAHSGLGLGLAIVRHLVELHGGCVRAANGAKGAVFSVRLPVAAVRVRAPEDSTTTASPEEPGAPPLGGLYVLVVDDEADARELISAVLADRGARVVAVASSREALEEIERQRPDVLVSDIGMPIEDGYSLIRRVRAMDHGAGAIPAAALTAYASTQDRSNALLAGYSSHLAKPIEPAELIAVVASLTGRGKRAVG